MYDFNAYVPDVTEMSGSFDSRETTRHTEHSTTCKLTVLLYSLGALNDL